MTLDDRFPTAQHHAKALSDYQLQRANPLHLSLHRQLRSTSNQPPPVVVNEYIPVSGRLPTPEATEEFTRWLLRDGHRSRQSDAPVVEVAESSTAEIFSTNSQSPLAQVVERRQKRGSMQQYSDTAAREYRADCVPTTKRENDQGAHPRLPHCSPGSPSPRFNPSRDGKGDMLRDFFLWITTRRDPTVTVQAILMAFGRAEVMSAYARLENHGWGLQDLQTATYWELEHVRLGTGGKARFSWKEGSGVGPMTAAKMLTPGLMEMLQEGAVEYLDGIAR